MNSEGTVESVFRKRFPRLAFRLRGLEHSKTLSADAENLASRSSDWPALLERWLEGLDLEANTAYALTGFGDGSHVAALLDKLPHGSYVFCSEKQVDSIVARSKEEKVVSLLEDPRLFIGIGDLDADFFESLSRFPVLELTDIQALVFSPIYNQAAEYYSAFLTEFTRSFEYWRKLYGTNVTASGRWQKNTFKNAPYLISVPDIQRLQGAFSGVPVIMVSAGPSLDVSLDFVKANENRCVIVAVNSSYRALRNYGVVPHFVIAADPYEYTDRGFEGVPCADTVLICPFIVYPPVVERFRGRIFTWSQNNLLASYLRLVTGKEMGSEIQEIGTVSACIFDIAKILCSPTIVFVGQDLSAKSDGQLHASDSFYSDLGANRLSGEDFRTVPGNVEESVRVEAKLFVYLKAFESLAQKHGADLELFNTSEFGARIEGIPYVSTDEMDQRLKRSDTSDFKSKLETIQGVLSSSESIGGRLEDVLESVSRFGKTVCEIALQGALALEEVLREDVADIQSAIADAESLKQDLEALLEGNSDLHKVMSDGALKYERTLYARAIQDLGNLEDGQRRAAEGLREYFWSIAEGSFSFFCEAEYGQRGLSQLDSLR